MSLYGPRINLPRVELPPSGGSWNLDKEKKIAFFAIIAIVIVVLLVLFLPPILAGISEALNQSFNPAVTVSWKNNPLDLTAQVKEAQLDIIITNTTKENKDVTFNISTASQEIIIFCPETIYDSTKGAYLLTNIAPNDNRRIPCIVRRNPNTSVFTGLYSIDITTSLGNAKTTLEILSK